jgi:hypothetical protein
MSRIAPPTVACSLSLTYGLCIGIADLAFPTLESANFYFIFSNRVICMRA